MNQPILPISPINTIVSIQPLTVSSPNRDATQADTPLATLAPGTSIEGFVINRDAKNNPILRTPIGDFVVQSTVFIKTGSVVVLRVDPSQTSRAKIVTVDGSTPEDYARKHVHGLTRDTIVQPQIQQSTRGATTLTTASVTPDGRNAGDDRPQSSHSPVLKVVVLQPNFLGPTPTQRTLQSPAFSTTATSVPQDPIPPGLAQISPGTSLNLTVLDVELPPSPVHLATFSDVKRLDQLLPGTPMVQPSTISEPQSSVSATSPLSSQQSEAADLRATPLVNAAAPPVSSPSPAPIIASLTTAVRHSTATAAPPTVPISSALAAQAIASAPEISTKTPSATPLLPTAAVPAAEPAETLPGITPQASYSTSTTGNARPLLTTTTASTLPAAPLPVSGGAYVRAASIPADGQPESIKTVDSSTSGRPAVAVPPSFNPTIRAEVIGHDADGANILHTSFASLKLYTTQPLPTGTNLMVKVTKENEPSAAPIVFTTAEHLKDIASYARDWQTLATTLGVLQDSSPVTAERLLQQIPALNHQFTSSMLFFLSALKGGSLREWLGERTIKQMEATAPAMLGALVQDVERMQHAFVHSPLADWSTTILPFMFGAELHQARLYVRNEDERGGNASGRDDKGQRFIVECSLSQLGELQMDGFVRPGESKKNFDLIIRGNSPLPSDIAQGIRNVFEATLAGANLNGQLSFQYGSQHFIRPLSHIQPSSDTDGVQPILA